MSGHSIRAKVRKPGRKHMVGLGLQRNMCWVVTAVAAVEMRALLGWVGQAGTVISEHEAEMGWVAMH